MSIPYHPIACWLIGLYLVVFSVWDLIVGSTTTDKGHWDILSQLRRTSSDIITPSQPLWFAILLGFRFSLGTGLLFFINDYLFLFLKLWLPFYLSLIVAIWLLNP